MVMHVAMEREWRWTAGICTKSPHGKAAQPARDLRGCQAVYTRASKAKRERKGTCRSTEHDGELALFPKEISLGMGGLI